MNQPKHKDGTSILTPQKNVENQHLFICQKNFRVHSIASSKTFKYSKQEINMNLTTMIINAMIFMIAFLPNIQIAAKENKKPNSPSGTVIVSLVSNSNYLSDKLTGWTSLAVVSKNRTHSGGKPVVYEIAARYEGFSSSRIFIDSLPVGKYRIGGLNSFLRWGDSSYFANAIAPFELGHFEVKAGIITDLGTMLIQPLIGDLLGEKLLDSPQSFEYVFTRLPDSSLNKPFIDQLVATKTNSIERESILSWLPDQFADKRLALTNKILERPAFSSFLFDKTSGQRIVTARLGQFYTQEGARQWRKEALDSTAELLAYTTIKNLGIFVGGEQGQVWWRKLGKLNWERLPKLDNEKSAVIWLGGAQNGDLIAVTSRVGRKQIWKTSFVDSSQWHLLASDGVEISGSKFRPGANYRAPKLVANFSSDGSIQFFDFANGMEYRDGKLSNLKDLKPSISNVQANGIVVMHASSSWSGFLAPLVSFDDGQTWKQYARLGWNPEQNYVFKNGQRIAPGDDASFIFVGWKKKPFIDLLSESPDSPKKVVGKMNYGCAEIVPEISTDESLIVKCANNVLLYSEDRGATWGVELEKNLTKLDFN